MMLAQGIKGDRRYEATPRNNKHIGAGEVWERKSLTLHAFFSHPPAALILQCAFFSLSQKMYNLTLDIFPPISIPDFIGALGIHRLCSKRVNYKGIMFSHLCRRENTFLAYSTSLR